MRTIDSTLLTAQKSNAGEPTRSLVIGTSPNTVNISDYIIGYRYSEANRETGLTIILDNHDGHFNTLSGDLANLTQGAAVELKRGIVVAGSDKLEELPRTWVEGIFYGYGSGQSVCVLECIDWRGKLARWRAASEQSWSSTSATTILEWILDRVDLTRASGTMTSFTLDFEIKLQEDGHAALKRLVSKMPEGVYPGLDAEIKWKDIDGSDASVYTFGWNAEHPALGVDGGESAWGVNSITVKGRYSRTGSASDATQIAKVGTRTWTIYDQSLKTNAHCTQRAQAELDQYEAEAISAIIRCRPCHGLELLDVVKIDDPPWGGADITGRVIQWVEEWSAEGAWHQIICLGNAPIRDPGKKPARHRRSSRSRRKPPSDDNESPWYVPIGGVIMWHGLLEDIPAGYLLCDGTNDTPNMVDFFPVGAGDTDAGAAYTLDDTGGEDESNIRHRHGDGTYTTANDTHNHSIGTPSAIVPVSNASPTIDVPNTNHNHGGITGNDTHNHNITGSSAYTGSETQENRPQYRAIYFIKRVE